MRVKKFDLPIKITFYNALFTLEDEEATLKLVHGADVLIIGGETWGQGSTRFLRHFFELIGREAIWGTQASAYTTAGGNHTGGEMVVLDSLRSLIGIGASTFSLGQKLMVFATDEYLESRKPGEFSELDVWYMSEFAKAIAVKALCKGDPIEGQKLGAQLGIADQYYRGFPKTTEQLKQLHKAGICDLINHITDSNSDEMTRIEKELEMSSEQVHQLFISPELPAPLRKSQVK